ncbi:hypothetical protein, partial [Burkholderia multivorans]|uniref:hypothetical protein n=2 Tax=Burkholderia multivorans TaxID=87883 RepID=UPI0021BE4BDD
EQAGVFAFAAAEMRRSNPLPVSNALHAGQCLHRAPCIDIPSQSGKLPLQGNIAIRAGSSCNRQRRRPAFLHPRLLHRS